MSHAYGSYQSIAPKLMNTEPAQAIKQKAQELGFELVGITGAEPSVFAAEYRDWIARGYAGEMGYLTRNLERRLDPSQLLPDARSIIVVGMNYYTDEEEISHAKTQRRKVEQASSTDDCKQSDALAHADGNIYCAALRLTDAHDGALSDPIQSPNSEIQDQAIFARYARGEDYHDVMTAKLRELLAFIKERQPFVPDRAEPADPSDTLTAGVQEASGPNAPAGSKRIKSAIAGEPSGARGELRAETPARVPTEGRVYVDTGPILEREVARRAGLGWFGKNTMLINTRRGSYFFLGEIITNLPLPPDEPAIGGCGTCTRCIDACPTGAIVAPFALDATRCISYLTIELKGEIPEEHRPAIAATNRIYGCDICQEVCPFNRPATASAHPTLVPTSEPAFQPRAATTNRTLSELALLTEEEFRRQFKGSPVKRAKWRGLIRNVAAALVTEEYPVEW